LPILKKAVENDNIKKLLKGEPVQPVFRKVDNFNMKPVKKDTDFTDFKNK